MRNLVSAYQEIMPAFGSVELNGCARTRREQIEKTVGRLMDELGDDALDHARIVESKLAGNDAAVVLFAKQVRRELEKTYELFSTSLR